MMETNQLAAMQVHCDELTRDGKELSVTWEGGNDSGWVYLKLDGQEIEKLGPLEEEILRLVEEHIEYGSFAGDFSTDGKIVYDREDKCFVGEDNYSETEQGVKECEIEIMVPEHIWFDTLEVRVTLEDTDSGIEADFEIHILNGPYPEAFDTILPELRSETQKVFSAETEDIEDFSGIWEHYILKRSDFKVADGKLTYKINQFAFYFETCELKDIYIPLSA